jgi:hypothetical protein
VRVRWLWSANPHLAAIDVKSRIPCSRRSRAARRRTPALEHGVVVEITTFDASVFSAFGPPATL